MNILRHSKLLTYIFTSLYLSIPVFSVWESRRCLRCLTTTHVMMIAKPYISEKKNSPHRLLWLETLTIYPSLARVLCDFQSEKLKCHGSLPEYFPRENVTILELHDLDLAVLELDEVLLKFPFLKDLTIENGNLSRIIPPKNGSGIEILRFTKLQIRNISWNFLQTLQDVAVLNLRGNNLDSFPANFQFYGLREIYLKDNRWNCSKNLDWVFIFNATLKNDIENVNCYGEPYRDKPILAVARYSKDLRKTCTPRCRCTLERITLADINTSEYELMPIIMVNCSKADLTELPARLPNFTRILHLENNMITNVEPLRNNRVYKGVWDLYLDHNQVKSIGVLEGTHWLSHFRTLSLRGNKLTKLPSYALDNALLKNPTMPITRIFLGDNPWKCDCAFTPMFQELVLRKYAAQVLDSLDVKCAQIDGDVNMKRIPIIELTRSSVCRLSSEYSLQQGLDLLNAVLASLIIFILAKLAYDYYRFKRTGRLPWIIMKMP